MGKFGLASRESFGLVYSGQLAGNVDGQTFYASGEDLRVCVDMRTTTMSCGARASCTGCLVRHAPRVASPTVGVDCVDPVRAQSELLCYTFIVGKVPQNAEHGEMRHSGER